MIDTMKRADAVVVREVMLDIGPTVTLDTLNRRLQRQGIQVKETSYHRLYPKVFGHGILQGRREAQPEEPARLVGTNALDDLVDIRDFAAANGGTERLLHLLREIALVPGESHADERLHWKGPLTKDVQALLTFCGSRRGAGRVAHLCRILILINEVDA